MAVIRQANLLSGQRIDVPDLRAMESAICGDFDVLAGRILSGKAPLIVRGFTIPVTSMLGAPANTLQMVVASGVLMNFNATQSGTVFFVPDGQANETLSATNTKVTGSFTANATNYIGLDFTRAADNTTSDTTKFLDATTKKEITKNVPKALTLNYQIVISNQPFSVSTTLAPIAIVVTDVNNNIVSVQDARNLAWRLGSGGTTPNVLNTFSWPDSTRKENTNTYSGSSSADPFSGGDKGIISLKSWMDSIMTRLWEVGGGEHWYSNTTDKNVVISLTGTTFSGGDYFEWTGTNVHWQGVTVHFANSTGSYNILTNQTTDSVGLTDLADGECIYVDIDRTQNATVTAHKGVLNSLGSPTIPGSRYVLAWRKGSNVFSRGSRLSIGTSTPATNTALGTVKLNKVAHNPASPVVPVLGNSDKDLTIDSTGTAFDAITAIADSSNNAIRAYSNGSGAGIYSGLGSGTGPGALFAYNAGTDAVRILGDLSFLSTGGSATGNINLQAANDYKYTGTRTQNLFVHPGQFGLTNTGTSFAAVVVADPISGTQTPAYITGGGSGVIVFGGAKFALPKGATITDVQYIVENTNGSSGHPLNVRVDRRAGNTLAGSAVITNGGNSYYTIVIPAASGVVAAHLSPYLNANTGVPDSSYWFTTSASTDVAGSSTDIRIYGVYVTFTLSVLAFQG